jgi:type IV pilus assembly protein PilY1
MNMLNRTNQLLSKAIMALLLPAMLMMANNAFSATALTDKPLFTGSAVPGNVALDLSVEFPTALGSAYTSSYDINKKFVGYFDSEKCYTYFADPLSVKSTLANKLYNTGVDNAGASLAASVRDSHWVIQNAPASIAGGIGGATYNKLDATDTGTGNAGSRYIGFGISGGVPAGNYTYKSNNFQIATGINPLDVQVSFTLLADDSLVDLQINGVSTGITSTASWNSPAVVTIPPGKFTANNTNYNITIIISNSSNGNTGIRIENMAVQEMKGVDGSYFKPASVAVGHVCTGYWSGNFLNWALTQTIDPFRYALSGGYRAVDKTNLTVLEKAWATGQGGTVANPIITNNATLIQQSTPFTNVSTLNIYINGQGNQFLFWGGTFDNNFNFLPDTDVTATPPSGRAYRMYGRVKVCDPTLLEANCTKYANGNYKPTGLIQKNAMKLNFAAFGYLLDADLKRDGGVLRARMSPLGPRKPVPNAPDAVNANAEWDENTGIFYTNPAATDASNSGVTNSGVINYLNKFGLTSKTYKGNDPVGELYYASLRYFKNQGNVAAYTSNLDDAKKDGFPVIDFKKDVDDPIQYACQANFIIGVGDSNTHGDGNLPGSTIAWYSEPSMPAEVTNDTSVNSKTATNKVGALENLNQYGNLGEKYLPWCCDQSTYLMAGLAYDAHTKDQRPDKFKNADGNKTKKQTIETYWLDVLESGDRINDGGAGMRNQFWLTAKYGGFNYAAGSAIDAVNYDPYASTVTAPALANWDKDGNNDGNDDPDNYFRANNPQNMIDGLTTAFADIISKTGGSSVAFAVASPKVNNGDMAFATSYEADGWVGNLIGSTIAFDTNGVPITTTVWNANDRLATQNAGTGWDTARYVATSKCATVNADGTKSCVGVPFRLTSLLAADKTSLTASGNNQQVLDFIRGDRTNEGGATNFRIRKYVFGDVVNSKVAVIGKPSANYDETSNPGYAAFKTTYQNRTNVAYIGANDGMLHALKATNTTDGGTELFAYVPSLLFNGPSGTPALDGLGALTKASFLHHFYVDSTPVVRDVNFGVDTVAGADWRTLLVGGLGKGGKGYYALDVTNPANLSNETNLAAAVKWEFTHNNMGYSYSRPLIVKANITAALDDGTSAYNGWVVVLTSGYNTADKNGYFFILNAKTGALLKKVQTYSTAPANDAGLSPINGFVNDGRVFVADAAYAGDLLGKVWRLDLKTLTVQNIASATDGTTAQPITAEPLIAVDRNTSIRYVFVGTGKMLDDSDAPNTQTHSFYAIKDGNSSSRGFFAAADLPTGVTFPITRSNLNDNSATYATTGVAAPAANTLGWYLDLADKYRINVNMANNAGLVLFAANKTGGDECNPEGTSKVYLLNYVSGKSYLTSAQAAVVYTSFANNVEFVQNVATGEVDPIVSTKDGKFGKIGTDGTLTSPNFKLLNWRDLPTAD